jgi:hypothetical protein
MLFRRSQPGRGGFSRQPHPVHRGPARGRASNAAETHAAGRADVEYVPSSENRSHGASLGNKLAEFCNGVRFRYVFR